MARNWRSLMAPLLLPSSRPISSSFNPWPKRSRITCCWPGVSWLMACRSCSPRWQRSNRFRDDSAFATISSSRGSSVFFARSRKWSMARLCATR